MAKLHSLIIALSRVCRNVTKKYHIMLTNSCFSCFQIIKIVIYQKRKLFEIFTIKTINLVKQLMKITSTNRFAYSFRQLVPNSFDEVEIFSYTVFTYFSCTINPFYPLSEYICAVISYKNNITLMYR